MTDFSITLEETAKMLKGENYEFCGRAPSFVDLNKAEEVYILATKKDVWRLNLIMCSDDDAQILYEGRLYCFYGEILNVILNFPSKTDALRHLTQEVKVIYGHKASKFTYDWLEESITRLVNGKEPNDVCGNQTYSITLEKIKE